MLRTLPPSGAPIKFCNVLDALKAEFLHDNSVETFKRQIADYLGCDNVFLLSSGKAAILLTLKALSSISDRKEVIIPAYTSFCLASAVAASRVHIKLCDMDPEYLDFDLQHLSSLVTERTLAVIPVHLFGLVARLDKIRTIADTKGAFIVEDAAQAAGAKYKGQYVGAIGDVGIYSLGRGKSISTVQGGIIITPNNHLSGIINDNIKKLSDPPITSKLNMLFNAFGLSLFSYPWLYFLPNSLPFLRLGANIYDPEFEVFSFSRIQAGMGVSLFNRLRNYNNKRRLNAVLLSSRITNLKYVRLPLADIKATPSYTRFPIIFKDTKAREDIFKRLLDARLGVSKNFPYPLNRLNGFAEHLLNLRDSFDVSKQLSEALLTVPTHPFVSRRDLDKIADIINNYGR